MNEVCIMSVFCVNFSTSICAGLFFLSIQRRNTIAERPETISKEIIDIYSSGANGGEQKPPPIPERR
jgi:hypothetical protein